MEENILTEAERQELEALRKEKKNAAILEFATENLKKYGAPCSFAQFVACDSEEATLAKIKSFTEEFGKVKGEIIAFSGKQPPNEEIITNKRSRGVKLL